jgi:hypothetical protein
MDFGKTFDKTEHELMLQNTRHKGFGNKWLQWTSPPKPHIASLFEASEAPLRYTLIA